MLESGPEQLSSTEEEERDRMASVKNAIQSKLCLINASFQPAPHTAPGGGQIKTAMPSMTRVGPDICTGYRYTFLALRNVE